MTRELLIFRHGKSDWRADASGDFHRPLAKRGRKAVKRMALWLRSQGLEPDCIVSSTAERARQTTLRLCRHGQIPESVILWQEEIYGADVQTLLSVLAHCPASERAMIVGHNPGFEELVEYLSGGPISVSGASPPMPTAAVAHLSMPEEWEHLELGCGQLISITRPRELNA
jgi:phosphohistidine phosphatase